MRIPLQTPRCIRLVDLKKLWLRKRITLTSNIRITRKTPHTILTPTTSLLIKEWNLDTVRKTKICKCNWNSNYCSAGRQGCALMSKRKPWIQRISQSVLFWWRTVPCSKYIWTLSRIVKTPSATPFTNQVTWTSEDSMFQIPLQQLLRKDKQECRQCSSMITWSKTLRSFGTTLRGNRSLTARQRSTSLCSSMEGQSIRLVSSTLWQILKGRKAFAASKSVVTSKSSIDLNPIQRLLLRKVLTLATE